MPRIRRFGSIVTAFICMMNPSLVAAQTINDVAVQGVGIQSINLYVALSKIPPGCSSNILYHASEGMVGQHVMGLLLTARASNMRLARLDYTVIQNGTCWIDLVQL